MASTMMLMKTRKEWTDAFASGETSLPHSEYADQKEKEYKQYELEQSVKQKPIKEPEKYNSKI